MREPRSLSGSEQGWGPHRLAPRPYLLRRRVRHRPETLAGRVALYVRWATYLLSFGKAGNLPWTWEKQASLWPHPFPKSSPAGRAYQVLYGVSVGGNPMQPVRLTVGDEEWRLDGPNVRAVDE